MGEEKMDPARETAGNSNNRYKNEKNKPRWNLITRGTKIEYKGNVKTYESTKI